MNVKKKDVLVTGFALFAMYFGAGNLIFPAQLGFESGTRWFAGFLTYMLADAGLVILTMGAILRTGRSYEGLMAPVGKPLTAILIAAVSLCIGPMIAIPRTAATSYETGFSDFMPIWLYSAVYFAVAILLCLNSMRIVNIVGKILTPVLVIGLVVLISAGILFPVGTPGTPPAMNAVLSSGILNGYQTLDGFAAILFSMILIRDIRNKKYQGASEGTLFLRSALIAFLALAVVYGGLTYLGATTGSLSLNVTNGTVVLRAVVEQLFGNAGRWLLTLVMLFACMTTTIGLIASIAEQLNRAVPKLSYRTSVWIVGLSGFLVANIGLNMLIQIAAPILMALYPPILMLVIHAYFKRYAGQRFGAVVAFAAAFIIGTLDVLSDLTKGFTFIKSLPLSSYGIGFLIPCMILYLVIQEITHRTHRS